MTGVQTCALPIWISAFDIHPDGSLGERRDWAKFGELTTSRAMAEAIPQAVLAPDGCGLDAEGCLWVADAIGGRVCRVREGGEILETVVPGTGVFACMLGGSDGRTLFMSCAPDFDEHARSAAREAEIRAGRRSRSEERRVGKECRPLCRSRWSPYH